jgi:hypothetical protein
MSYPDWVPATMASKPTLRTVSCFMPSAIWKALAMQYSKPFLIWFGSVLLPIQNPGPGSDVTTDSVSALLGLNPLTGPR